MIVSCAKCGARYNDEFRWTICPHETFAANDGRNHFEHHPESHLSQGEIGLPVPSLPIVDFVRATEVTPEVEAAIVDAFQYHPWTAEQQAAGQEIRDAGIAFIKAIVKNAPPSADRSAAIRKVREARMDANSAITHGGKY